MTRNKKRKNNQTSDTQPWWEQDDHETEKLFVYGIFLDEDNRDHYGMSNPRYTTVPYYLTVGHGIVQAVKTDNEYIALTGLLVDMDVRNWDALDMLEGGYDRIKVTTDSDVQAWMYAQPERKDSE